MNKIQNLLRKIVATILSVTIMCAMLWFAYTMLISTPIFDGALRVVLLACIGVLTLATLYFFVCKIFEITALLRGQSKKMSQKQKNEQALEEQPQETAKTE